MSALKKPVSRTTGGIVREAGKPREVIVILRPPNVLGFRAKGCRTEYQITTEVGWMMAVKAHQAAAQRAKR
jgi:hypothetical protein